MSYVNPIEMLKKARKGSYAVGAFNILDPLSAVSVIKAAEKKNSPVILQTSVKTVRLYGPECLYAAVKAAADKVSVPVALHLDHCKDLNILGSCLKAGWSSVMIDASSFPMEVNLRLTSEAVRMAIPFGAAVEGEIGAIVGVEDDIHVNQNEANLANPQEAISFAAETGIDILAPAIGTAHGYYKGTPRVSFDILKEIADKTDSLIAIHGGTGLSDEIFHRCIDLGGCKVNISTRLKKAFLDSVKEFLASDPNCGEPVKVMGFMQEQLIPVVSGFMDKFGSENKA